MSLTIFATGLFLGFGVGFAIGVVALMHVDRQEADEPKPETINGTIRQIEDDLTRIATWHESNEIAYAAGIVARSANPNLHFCPELDGLMEDNGNPCRMCEIELEPIGDDMRPICDQQPF